MSVPTLRCTLRILQCSHTDRRKCYNHVYVCIMEAVLVSKISVSGAHWGIATVDFAFQFIGSSVTRGPRTSSNSSLRTLFKPRLCPSLLGQPSLSNPPFSRCQESLASQQSSGETSLSEHALTAVPQADPLRSRTNSSTHNRSPPAFIPLHSPPSRNSSHSLRSSPGSRENAFPGSSTSTSPSAKKQK